MNRLRNNKGQALVEFTLVSIVLMMFALGVAEFARAWYYDNALENAVRAGVRYATELTDLAPNDPRIQSYVQGQVPSSLGGVTVATAVNSNLSFGTEKSVTVTATCSFSFLEGGFFSKYLDIPASLTLSRAGTMYYKRGT